MPTASPRTLEKPTASFSVVTGARPLAPSQQVPDLRRGLLLVALAALMSFEVTREMTIALLADAFWQVASYVAFTLAIFYAIQERIQRGSRLSGMLSRNRALQVAFGAVMGVLPGCGGALIVITQFVKKQISFGALVAALTATMGDAAFLLLSADAGAGMVVIGVCAGTALISGLLIDRIHEPSFMRPDVETGAPLLGANDDVLPPRSRLEFQGRLWKMLLVPACVVAVVGSLQLDLDVLLGMSAGTTQIVGAGLAGLALFSWSIERSVVGHQTSASRIVNSMEDPLFQRVARETNFVLCWVVLSFLAFELFVMVTGVELSALFQGYAGVSILAAICIGLIPGCGPQILTTSLFIKGLIPLSAQLGNAISNDGDALFPALALAPKAALVATLYSTVPATIVAYGFHLLFES